MKIRTYVAPDMRQALRLVRDEQGPDAVILSTRSVSEGVEVVAAVDAAAAAEATAQPAASGTTSSIALQPTLLAPREAPRVEPVAVAPAPAAAPAAQATPAPAAADIAAAVSSEVNAELRSLRQILEGQLAQLAWNDLSRRAPAQAQVLKELTEIGLSTELATELVAGLPPNLTLEEASRRTLAQLARRIMVTGDRWLEQGGRIAFVGPTGVGKTTAIAKLAARWVMAHGTHDITLISIDATRIGAQEQIRVLGRLLDVQALSLEHASELPDLIANLARSARGTRLTLIDTAGTSPRDPELTERLEALQGASAAAQLETCLVVAASAQAAALEETARRYAPAWPTTCLVTKVDEAPSLGGTLSMLIRAQLPLTYVSEGQRVPEDLIPARAHQLVARAVNFARTMGAAAGEEMLARRFGGSVHALA